MLFDLCVRVCALSLISVFMLSLITVDLLNLISIVSPKCISFDSFLIRCVI